MLRPDRFTLALLSISALAGCSSASNDGDAPLADSQDVEPPKPGMVRRTVVDLRPDGTTSVTHDFVTVEEQRAEVADQEARARAARDARPGDIHTDDVILTTGSCSWNDVKLFDGAGYTGNSICFRGFGLVDLTQYCDSIYYRGRCLHRWSGGVRSYWSGSNIGVFTTRSPYCSDYMPLYEAVATPSACVTTADLLRINEPTL